MNNYSNYSTKELTEFLNIHIDSEQYELCAQIRDEIQGRTVTIKPKVKSKNDSMAFAAICLVTLAFIIDNA